MRLIARISRNTRGYFTAWCPALPGCAVRGRSRDDAHRKIERAVRGYLAALDVVLPRELARLAEAEG